MSATIQFALLTVSGRGQTGAALPIPDSAALASVEATTTASSAVVAIAATAAGQVWRVTVSDGNAYVKFGTGTPNAAAGPRHKLIPGRYEFAAMAADETVAIMDAP